MILRAWFLVAIAWALVFLASGATKVDGIGAGDVALAFAPAVIGVAIVFALRYIVYGGAGDRDRKACLLK